MTALAIIFGVLLFLFLLTVIPIKIDIAFSQSFAITLRYAFLRFKLYPSTPKATEEPDKPEPDKPESTTLDKLKNIVKNQGVSGFLKSLFELAKIAAGSSKRLLSHIRLRRFDLYLCLGCKDDPGAAALRYGEISGAVYSACGVLFGLFNCQKKAVSVDLNYANPEDTVIFTALASIRPIFLIKEIITLIKDGLPVLRRLLSSTKHKERISQQRKQGESQ